MNMNKNLLMQPLTDDALADVTGGAGAKRSQQECYTICGMYEETVPMVYAQCMAACITGQNMNRF